MQLTSLGNGAGHLKAGLLGFAGGGKTYTAKVLAIGTRKHFGLKGPIGMLDTEAAAQYIAQDVKKETGQDLIGVQTRALSDAVDFMTTCIQQKVSVAIIDSVTHLWRELCDSYLKQKNDALVRANRSPQKRLEFQDWNPVKAKWATFADMYLNAPLHVIICGRAGYEYDFEENEDTGKKELIKTGIKMKTEGEFGFEPSLLIQMESIQLNDSKKIDGLVRHRATVIKDRFGVLDGKACDNPTYEFFKPYVDLLTVGAHASIDMTRNTDMGVNDDGDAKWQHEKKQRTIFCEEIQGLLTQAYPGQSAADKKAKVDILERAFGVRSWTAVEGMKAEALKKGLDSMPEIIGMYNSDFIKSAEKALSKAGKE